MATGTDSQHTTKNYSMPAFTDELIYQLVFCMEDQDNEYVMDLESGEIIFSSLAGHDAPERYLELPPWRPADGFRTMEKFVASLRNPIHREHLRSILQSGKGVFRQFKLWYYFKDREIRNAISIWYEKQNEAYRLSRLSWEPDEDASDLLLSDFTIVLATDEHSSYVERAMQDMSEEVMEQDIGFAGSLLQYWKSAASLQTFIVYADTGSPVGFLSWKEREDMAVQVLGYRIAPEYRGMGLFRLLFDHMNRSVARRGFFTVSLPLVGNALRAVRMFDDVAHTITAMEVQVRIHDWNEKEKSSEEAYL